MTRILITKSLPCSNFWGKKFSKHRGNRKKIIGKDPDPGKD